jgi:uncharacterized delta-60 repeat protein
MPIPPPSRLTTATVLLLMGLFSTRVEAQTALDGFNADADAVVQCAVVQKDCRILLGGDFSTIAGAAHSRIARLDALGQPEASFTASANGLVHALAEQPDGRILVAGNFTTLNGQAVSRIGRLLADGSLDAGFSASASGTVRAVAVQKDGRIVIAGEFATVNGTSRTRLARLLPDGSLDAGFSPTAASPSTNPAAVRCLTLQPDGKILLGGEFTLVNGVAKNRIARLLPDGTLDAGFTATIGATTANAVNAIALQPNGMLLAGGTFASVNAVARANFVRLQAGGATDATFTATANAEVFSLLVQPDGKIVLGGNFTSVAATTRTRISRVLAATGANDASFVPPTNGANAKVSCLAIQPDGKLIAGGDFTLYGTVAKVRSMRLYTDGSADLTFATAADQFVKSVATQPDGRIYLGGFFSALGATPRSGYGRLKADATVDTAYATTVNDEVEAMVLHTDGKVTIGGWFDTPIARFARLLATGGRDTTFAGTADNIVSAMAVQPDGKLLVGGAFTEINGEPHLSLGRVSATGVPESPFVPDPDSTVTTIVAQDDGRLVVGGNFVVIGGEERHGLARLNAAGVVEEGFNPGVTGLVQAISLQADGKILIGGDFSFVGGLPRSCLARLNADGTLDATFTPNPDRVVYSLTLQTDGKILVAGDFTSIAGQPRQKLARLHANGALDAAFSADANSLLQGLALQPDGKLLVGGFYTTIAGQSRSRIARLATPEPARQVLTVDPSGSSVTWQRSGPGPEIHQVTFEQSADGATYTPMASPVRMPGGWTLAGLALPLNQNVFIRARGRTYGGAHNSSVGWVESIRVAFPAGSPFASWQMLHFATTSGPAAPDIDPDGDGLTNIVEYATGSDPNIYDAANVITAGWLAGKLTASFPRNTGATDVLIRVQASADLQSWEDLAASALGNPMNALKSGATAAESGAGAVRAVTVTDFAAGSSATHPRAFLRVVAEYQP